MFVRKRIIVAMVKMGEKLLEINQKQQAQIDTLITLTKHTIELLSKKPQPQQEASHD